jgi:Ca2+-binding RTX toxin-like protein
MASIYGTAGNDTKYGTGADDSIYGGSGNDTLYGGSGDDTLYGGSGNDQLLGRSGKDNLYGGTGADEFIFGTYFAVDYDNFGNGDYAVINDFSTRQDSIRLTGLITDYSLKNSPISVGSSAADTAIYYNNNELIGIVADVSGLSLGARYFSYVSEFTFIA